MAGEHKEGMGSVVEGLNSLMVVAITASEQNEEAACSSTGVSRAHLPGL
jgi:hypothetical protein